ncbi:MAG: tagaturonate reductase [Oscillospiraceae bacterium]
MERLNYDLLQRQGYEGYLLPQAPERVLQFGEGNFLRAFADYFIDISNEKAGFNGKVCVVQPIAQGLAEEVNRQQGLYTVYLRGYDNGEKVSRKRVVSSISRALNPYTQYQDFLACAKNPDLRYIISNTTEAGIVFDEQSTYGQTPPQSFPAKLTRFMHERFVQKGKGFVVLSCELIDHNGDELKRCVKQYVQLWKLGEAFERWVEEENIFCSTMVDRIVTGYPAAEAEELNRQNGYEDKLLDAGEVFAIWVIEGPASLREELPFEKAGLPVVVCDDCAPYKQRKVRILNGVQTGMVLASYLSGQNIVRFCMDDETIVKYMKKTIYEEIIPSLDLPREDMLSFAKEVFQRLKNPFIDHKLLDISLNTTAKWRARDLPSVKDYYTKYGKLPACLVFSFAAYLKFYHCERLEADCMVAKRGSEEYKVRDDRYVLEFFAAHKNDDIPALVQSVCANRQMWGEDLNKLGNFAGLVQQYLQRIEAVGMAAAMKELL